MEEQNNINKTEEVLTEEQIAYINKPTFGGVLGGVYALASGLYTEFWLYFIPFYNLYLLYKLIRYGRKMSWERKLNKNFEDFKYHQDKLAKTSKILTLIFVIYFAFIFSLVFGVIFFISRSSTNNINYEDKVAYIQNKNMLLNFKSGAELYYFENENSYLGFCSSQEFENYKNSYSEYMNEGSYDNLYCADSEEDYLLGFSLDTQALDYDPFLCVDNKNSDVIETDWIDNMHNISLFSCANDDL